MQVPVEGNGAVHYTEVYHAMQPAFKGHTPCLSGDERRSDELCGDEFHGDELRHQSAGPTATRPLREAHR